MPSRRRDPTDGAAASIFYADVMPLIDRQAPDVRWPCPIARPTCLARRAACSQTANPPTKMPKTTPLPTTPWQDLPLSNALPTGWPKASESLPPAARDLQRMDVTHPILKPVSALTSGEMRISFTLTHLNQAGLVHLIRYGSDPHLNTSAGTESGPSLSKSRSVAGNRFLARIVHSQDHRATRHGYSASLGQPQQKLSIRTLTMVTQTMRY